MLLTKRQNAAINQIIQEEVQSALRGRRSIAASLRRGRLLEAADPNALFEAGVKVTEMVEMLVPVKALVGHDAWLGELVGAAEQALSALQVALDETAGGEDTFDRDDSEMDESYGDDLDEEDEGMGMEDLLPRHPRAHDEPTAPIKKRPPPPPFTQKRRPPPPPPKPWGKADDGEVDLPPMHPRGR